MAINGDGADQAQFFARAGLLAVLRTNR